MVGNMICRENGDGVRFGHSSATYGGDENAPSAKGGGTLLPLVLARVKMTAPLKTASYINVTGTVWFHPQPMPHFFAGGFTRRPFKVVRRSGAAGLSVRHRACILHFSVQPSPLQRRIYGVLFSRKRQ